MRGFKQLWPADLNLDGVLDVLATTGLKNNTVGAFLNIGDELPEFEYLTIAETVPGANGVTSADLNRDGLPDAVVACEDGNSILWYEQRGTEPFVVCGAYAGR